MAFNLDQGKALIDRLSTEKLEKLVGADIDIDKAPDDILRWHLYAVAKLYHRYKKGERTTTDKWKAYHFSNKIKHLSSHKRLTDFEQSDDFKHIIEEAKKHEPPKNFWSTTVFYTFFTWYTQVRLSTTRTNRLLGLLEKAFLPAWFAMAGLLFAAELILDFSILIKATFRPKTEEEKKMGAGLRFKLALFKDNRLTRMANAALWFALNLACFVLPFVLAGTITILGFPLTVPLIVAGLTLCGVVLDIFVDASGGLYAFKQENDLRNELDILEEGPEKELTTIKKSLDNKKRETLIGRFFRVFNSDVIMATSMFMVFFPPTTFIAMIILGANLALITAEFGASFALKNTRANIFDKARIAVVAAILTAALLLIIFPPAGLALTLPIIGASIVVSVGLTALARRIFNADTQWVNDKFSLLWNNIKGIFVKKADQDQSISTPDLNVSETASLLAKPTDSDLAPELPKGKSEDPLAPSSPAPTVIGTSKAQSENFNDNTQGNNTNISTQNPHHFFNPKEANDADTTPSPSPAPSGPTQ